nr:EOG090X051P [Triops cancriformis]
MSGTLAGKNLRVAVLQGLGGQTPADLSLSNNRNQKWVIIEGGSLHAMIQDNSEVMFADMRSQLAAGRGKLAKTAEEAAALVAKQGYIWFGPKATLLDVVVNTYNENRKRNPLASKSELCTFFITERPYYSVEFGLGFANDTDLKDDFNEELGLIDQFGITTFLRINSSAGSNPCIFASSFEYSDMEVRLGSPKEIQAKPEVSKLVFGKSFSDHMFEVAWEEKTGWGKPLISPLHNLSLHPGAKVLHYALELFEGMKAYRGVDGKIRLFRPDCNMERLLKTAERSCLPTFNAEEMIKCLKRLVQIEQEWVPHSESSSLYIRPTLIGTEPTLGVAATSSALLYVILCPVGPYFASGFKPISLLADPQFVRAWPGGCGASKMGSNYAPTIQIQKLAEKKGHQQVLWLFGDDHQLTEAGTMNIFVYLINENNEKELVTPPLNGLILPGVTRRSLLELAKQWGEFKVSERKITMAEILKAHKESRLLEAFGAGTACVVCPIANIGYQGQNIAIPTVEHAQPVHQRFLKAMNDIQYGRVAHPWADQIKSKNSVGNEDYFDHPFLQACTMFIGEMLCLVAFKVIFAYRKYKNRNEDIAPLLARSENVNWNPIIFLPPALLDMLATSIMYVGLNLTFASSFQMLRGAVIIFTGLLSVAFLGRVLSVREWIGMFVVILGLSVVGASDFLFGNSNSDEYPINNVITGIFGFITLSLLLVPMYYIPVGPPFNHNPREVLEDALDGLIQISNSYLLITAITGTIISIAFFNFAGVSVTKELSATTRMVLDSVRTLVIWVASLALRWQSFYPLQILGFTLLICGMCVYNNVIIVPLLQRCGLCKQEEQSATLVLPVDAPSIQANSLTSSGQQQRPNIVWADMTESWNSATPSQKVMFNHPFVEACFMFIGEILCLIAYYAFKSEVAAEDKWNRFILYPAAFSDMTSTCLMYVGLVLTYPSSYQILRGASVIFTAILSRWLLKRKIPYVAWFGICVISAGLVVVGISDFVYASDGSDSSNSTLIPTTEEPDSGSEYTLGGIVTGDILIVLAQIVSAYQVVYEEKYLTKYDINALQVVGLEGVFGFVTLTLLLIPFYYIPVPENFSGNPRNVLEDGIDAFVQMGNNPIIILALSILGTFIYSGAIKVPCCDRFEKPEVHEDLQLHAPSAETSSRGLETTSYDNACLQGS